MLSQKLAPHFSSLIQKEERPLAVAFSGGGDSTALLYMLLEWVEQNNSRDVFALIVDHGLRDDSADEAKIAARRAQGMGAIVEILNWDGVKPNTGIQEKARIARYALLGQACRRLRAAQLFLGHNQDDQAETIYMRIQNQTGWRGMAGMGARRVSPLWPELYDVETIRPLLDISREDLRSFCKENHLAYIDDPSNENREFTRIRIRHTLAEMPEIQQQLLQVGMSAQDSLRDEMQALSLFMLKSTEVFDWGGIRVNANNFTAYPEHIVEEALKYLILAVSGGNQATPQIQRQSLVKRLTCGNFKGATLGGVQFIPKGEIVLLVRDPGAVLGRAEKPAHNPIKLLPQTSAFWDGRYKVETRFDGASIAPLMKHVDKLSKRQKQNLKEIPLEARAGLPCLLKEGGLIAPYLDGLNPDVDMQCLVKERLLAMVGEG